MCDKYCYQTGSNKIQCNEMKQSADVTLSHVLDEVVGSRLQVSQFDLRCITAAQATNHSIMSPPICTQMK